ncbi:1-phosphatidylinositol 4,5-bisphosphate phosphodiesterase eta-2 [Tamandua tetradactyla]|uniref:1-phosphatidylinositol 4,5-bisphosphate phosphodiesterase eta-2 n=1 Tax=Tamandua tetradactyla TaxID=48850 RepID=UPI0040549256
MEEPGAPGGFSPDRVEQCMAAMQAGTQMVKLRGTAKGLARFYYLDEHRSCVRWRPSRKSDKAKISIDSIQEVSEGRQSEIFQRYPGSSFDPNCCFSIYHGEHRVCLDLVSASSAEARTWVTGLRYLLAGIRDEDSLARRQRTRDQWLKQTFDEADKNGDGSLSLGEVARLLHKLNVSLPRRRVEQMFKEADTDDRQGALGFEEFCAFYKAMSTRRDLYLLLLAYSGRKEHLNAADLQRFLQVEQKMTGVTLESCRDIVEQFEPCPENRRRGVLGIDGFTNYTRSPAGDIFNPEHRSVHQDMTRPLSHYFVASSHNTYLVGDQLMSQSRVDMYARVLQAGCRCVEVDCWDGPDGEPIVHHGYTLTSKILFKDVIETINRYAFVKNEYPVILSIENHCSVAQQKKMAQYLTDILGDKLDLSAVSSEDATMLPSPQMLVGKVLVKGKKLPANLSEDAEEGEVSDEDSADEIDDDCKFLNGEVSSNRKRVESMAKRKLDSLVKESKIRDCEDPNGFAIATLRTPSRPRRRAEGRKSKAEEDVDSGEDAGASRRDSPLLMSSFSKRKKKGSRLKKAASVEEGAEDPGPQGAQSRGVTRQKKTMQLSRALSDLVKYTKSVGAHDVETEAASSWQVSSFSEARAQQILQQKAARYLRFNQRQLSRIYPSSYRVDSSNYNPQPFWNAGCQMVALNYQSEGRMLQLNRAKFSANGNCGYVLKPPCMCQGVFNPNSADPLPGQLRKQLVLRIISGQQLPKPPDSVLGDRGEIIDPFVEVEVIGLPVDCSKEQTGVVDDNGFNPMWEETLVFVVHMPEMALVRFLVWDHDPIGRDFIGQRTLAFSSLMPGYRHVYLEGMEEASIFVHVAVSDISGKVKQALGLKGLFLRGPKPGSLDSHAAGRPPTRPSVSQRLLRRTASAPTKTLKPSGPGFPELAGVRDAGSPGAADDVAAPTPPPPPPREGPGSGSPRGKALVSSSGPGAPPRAPEGPGPAGVAATCMKCVVGACAGADPEGLLAARPPSPAPAAQPAAIRWQPRASATVLASSSEAAQGHGSPDSSSPEEALARPEGAHRPPGALQREMNALFVHELEEARSKPSLLPADARPFSMQRPSSSLCSLETIAEEPALGPPPPAVPTSPDLGDPQHSAGACVLPASPPGNALGASAPSQHRTCALGEPGAIPHSQQRAWGGGDPGGTCEGATSSQTDGRAPPPRAKNVRSEGQGTLQPPGGRHPAARPSPTPTVYSDATGGDRLWQRLEPGSHRDSVSSSSSMSSSDTVIDLSLSSLGLGRSRESLPGALAGRLPPRPRLAARPDPPPTAKSKSNPNLRLPSAPDELRPRPLALCPPGLCSRQPWGRLSLVGLLDCPAAAKSKSLGDLTADDFAPSFESRLHSLSHGLGPPGRTQRAVEPRARQDTLTEQLRWLTGFQQAGDITSPTSLGPAGEGVVAPGFLRRSSSRSQSRVRAIASRARQAQERQQQRQQGRGMQGPPEEERGTPEGACFVGCESCEAAAGTEDLLLLRI